MQLEGFKLLLPFREGECKCIKVIKKSIHPSLFWQTSFTCQHYCSLFLDTVCAFTGYTFIPRATSVTTYNKHHWHRSHGPSFNSLNSRPFAGLALYTAQFLLNDMPFRKGQFLWGNQGLSEVMEL